MTRRINEPPLLLSLRAAARLLGVGRNNTLPELIAKGHLRPVKVGKREYIPREQVEHLARHGEQPGTPKRKGGSIADVEID